MKRFLLSILVVVIELSAFSQPPSRQISLRPSYPLVVGETSIDGVIFSSNELYLHDVIQDSLPSYEIGHIEAQTVRYSEDGYGFYVKADSLHSLNVTYSYELSEQPKGAIEFNEQTGRFKFYPASDDYRSFMVNFTASNGVASISEEVEFDMMPLTPSEANAFYTKGAMPSADDYTTVAESASTQFLNSEERTAYSVSIAGKDVVFDDAIQNKVWGLNGREDIYEMNIYAERLIIRAALRFPQTNITIYAKELIFEDKDGVLASINTTPSTTQTLTDGEGMAGANAGDIVLNIKEFKGNAGFRLILAGAKGQSTNRNGTPGKGGNGGNVYSTIDVSSYCDMVRGSGGAKFSVAADGSTNAGAPIAYGSIGNNGSFSLIDDQQAYLHPYYISAVMRHANDAFINNQTEYVLQTCREYHELITTFVNAVSSGSGEVNEGDLDDLPGLDSRRLKVSASMDWTVDNERDEEKMAMKNELLEIDKMLFKLEQGLDYFGNPAGWVPLLSFEVMLANYENEIDRAIPTLYMYYWLNRIDQTLQNKVKACQLAADAAEGEMQDNMDMLNSLVLEVPVLQDEANEISAMIDVLTERIVKLQDELMAQAIHNVKRRSLFEKIFGIGRTIANIMPIVPVVGTAVSKGLNFALDATNFILQQTDGVDYSSLVTKAGVQMDKDYVNRMQININGAKTSISQKDWKGLFAAGKSMYASADTLISNVKNVYDVLSKNSAPDSEIQAEYNRLIASSPEWNRLKGQVDELNEKKEKLLNHMNEVFENMTSTMSELSSNVLALDAFRHDVFTGKSKRDLNAMIYLEKMEQRAKDRLLLYDYYLRKAYEYRLLKPYEGEYNLVSMFERFQSIAEASDSVIDTNAYNTLSAVFRERIADMANKIVTEYSVNSPEQSAPITIVIPKEQLNIINSEGRLTLNFHELGIFSSDEENVRIVDLGIHHIDTHVEGSVGYSGKMDLNLTHSGISQFRKDGNLYWFDHMSRQSTSPHTWGMRYDAVSGESTNIQPSAASRSLLSSIIGGTNNLMLFSRPSAWSDISLRKNVHTAGGADIVIDSLVLRLQYDFTRRPDNICNIDICANDGLLPYTACSEIDINGRRDGRGHLYRSYKTSNQTVTFTAVDKYGVLSFVNWTDRSGKVVSDKLSLTVSKSKDQFYMANYEYLGPVLSVPDTIRVSNEGGVMTVNVSNTGVDESDMEWYVADSLSTWVHIEGVKEGIGNGSFNFVCEPNPDGEKRVDSLDIVAPDAYLMHKRIYIVQTDEVASVDLTDVSKLKNAVYIQPVIATAGSKVTATVKLKNAIDVGGYSFDLELPNGVSVALNNKGKPTATLIESRHDQHSISVNYADGFYSVAVLSLAGGELSGNDGGVVTLQLAVSNEMKLGTYPIKISGGAVSTPQAVSVPLPDVITSITIGDVQLGDVNNDRVVNIADAIGIVNRVVRKESATFVEKAADVNGDGLVNIADAIAIVNIVVRKDSASARRIVENINDPQ